MWYSHHPLFTEEGTEMYREVKEFTQGYPTHKQ